jgi:hypothetical protein
MANFLSERLERDTAGQTRVVGEIHDPHAAPTDLVPDDVRSDQPAVE